MPSAGLNRETAANSTVAKRSEARGSERIAMGVLIHNTLQAQRRCGFYGNDGELHRKLLWYHMFLMMFLMVISLMYCE